MYSKWLPCWIQCVFDNFCSVNCSIAGRNRKKLKGCVSYNLILHKLQMWCPICFDTMSCPKDQMASYNASFCWEWREEKRSHWIFCFHFLLIPVHTTPLSYLHQWLLSPYAFHFAIYYQCLSAIFSSISLSLSNNSAILAYFLCYWSSNITNLFSPGSCLSVLILPLKLIVKCLNLPFTFSVITIIQDTVCKTGNPSLWKIAQKHSSCPSILIL